MITRVVKMHFRQGTTDTFLKVFDEHRQAIRSFPGCLSLELLQDVDQPDSFITLSQWEGPEALEQYRQSALFSGVWKQVKPLFSDKTIAFTARTRRS